MSLSQGVKAIQESSDDSDAHIFGFDAARSTANSILVDIWNGSTAAARKACVGKDGYFYSNPATAGDVPYFTAGGISNVKKMSYLNIGAANTVLTSSGTAPQWSTSLSGLESLAIDNISIDGNTITATSGAVNITPAAGSAIVLDGTISVDAGVVTGATSITSAAINVDALSAVGAGTSMTFAVASSAAELTLTNQYLHPTTGTVTLGSVAHEWNGVYTLSLFVSGNLDHDGENIGFFGTAPAAQAAAYTPTNVSIDRAFDADAVAVAELADVVGTLIADLQSYGLLQ